MIISDTTTLIVLDSIDRFDLLKVFGKIYIPQNVLYELNIKIKHKLDFKYEIIKCKNTLYNDLLLILDKGEAEAISCAKTKNLPLIIDEKKGRAIAKKLGIVFIGFLGVLCKNIQKDIISKDEALEILTKAKSNDFRISERIIEEFKKSCK